MNCAIPPGRSCGFIRKAVRAITSTANSLLKLQKHVTKKRVAMFKAEINNSKDEHKHFSDDETASCLISDLPNHLCIIKMF